MLEATLEVARPKNWVQLANEAQSAKELAAVRESLRRGRPVGQAAWQARTAARLGLQSTFRDRSRPKKQEKRNDK